MNFHEIEHVSIIGSTDFVKLVVNKKKFKKYSDLLTFANRKRKNVFNSIK